MPECQCENAGWCDLFKKEMTYDPPNWQWCKSLSEDQRRDYFNKMDSTVRVLKKAPDETKADIVNFFDILPEKKSKYAVCVIPANDSAMELLDITRSGVKKYAEKCGADYIELSGDQNPNWPMSNKYRLNRVAKAYDKTLYLDCDIVVKDDAPNIFELTPDDKISAYDEYEIFEQRNDTGWIRKQQESIFLTTLDSFPEEIKEEYVKNGEFITESMINGGVLVVPNALADYYKQPSSPYTKFWCFDQHLLTLELPEEKFNNLTHKFNCEYERKDFWNFIHDAHFIHLNGLNDKPDLRKSLLNQFSFGDFKKAISVGFIAISYLLAGGTETFHRSLIPRLKNVVDIVGFVATTVIGGDGSKLAVPYHTGVEAAIKLASDCDVLVIWGIDDIAHILQHNRPRIIAVHHGDWASVWSNYSILKQTDVIDDVVCVNADTASRLSECVKNVYFIPNAIDPDRITPSGNQSDLRSLFGISPDSKIVLFGHRLSHEKRPRLAVEIAQHLPDDWVMVIAGDGPERSAVEAAAAEGCNRVRIVGSCDSLADWLQLSDCFLSLATEEGFGLSVGEAMAAGVPTVSTPAGIAPGLATTMPTDSTAAEWAEAIVNSKVLVQPKVILERFNFHSMINSWVRVIGGLQ
jgi:glycosyltransferase involved in cell wall biosynthesis